MLEKQKQGFTPSPLIIDVVVDSHRMQKFRMGAQNGARVKVQPSIRLLRILALCQGLW
jgi:hypothetical protein